MSRRSGQSGSVYVKGSQYIGRYRVDVPGQNKRVRPTVIIGNIDQFTRPKAERKGVRNQRRNLGQKEETLTTLSNRYLQSSSADICR
jgi:hypothetical protein